MKIITTTLVTLDDNEFNTLVNEHFPQVEGEYELVPFQEIGSEKISTTIDMEFHDKYYGLLGEEFTTVDSFRFKFKTLCHELVKKGVFPEDCTIIVDASW